MGISLRATAMQSLAFGGISGTYAQVGTPPLNDGIMLYIVNATDAPIIFSFTGNTDHIYIAANGFFLFDIQSDKDVNEDRVLDAGTRYFVKQASGAPTSGAVYISHFYGF